eukprot:Phypoly_transcript_07030.p1 GENE.Phypoly_transcript_07030~~Phypoly_transcript_07030.p1  ORF type:complete len:531 (+),score=96.62 Phypoly_transcript_07030:80-1672(+)
MQQLGRAELNDEFQDPRFDGYSLSRDLVRSATPLALPAPPYSPPSNDISLQRYQARFKFNRLYVSPSPLYKKALYAGNDKCVYSVSLQDKPNFTPVFKIPEKDPAPPYADDISMGIVQITENTLLLFVADGQGRIYILDLNDPNRTLFDADVPALAGKPFTIVDCGASKSGKVRCLVQHIADASLSSTPANVPANNPVHFVRESEGSSDSSDAPQMEIGAQPKTTKIVTHFHVHLLTFAPGPNKSYTLESTQTLRGDSALAHGLLDSDGDGILLISNSLFVPDGFAPESFVKSPTTADGDRPAIPGDLSEMAARLAFMTSEKADANPYSLDLMRGKVVDLDDEDLDDESGIGGPGEKGTDLLNIYHYDATSSPPCKPTHTLSLATFTWVCLGALQFSKSGRPAQFTTVGLKCGVDCCAFTVTSHPDNKNEPFTVEQVANFPALSYVQNGKKNRKFTSFDPTFKWACVTEFERFAYFYKNQLPINPSHKSVHQIFELPEGTGNVVGMQFLPENVCLMLTTRDVLVIQLKEV